jgi:hypothetical protein
MGVKKTTIPQPGEPAFIQCAKTCGREEDEVQVEFNCGNTHIRIGMTLPNFAEMLMGNAKTPCKIRRWRQ